MALVSIRLEGLAQALKDIDGDAEAFLKEADKRIKVAGVRIEAFAKEIQTPHIDSGWLNRNIRHDPAAPFLEAAVTSKTSDVPDDDYARYHEYGTSRSQAYPYMRPATERALKLLTEEIANL